MTSIRRLLAPNPGVFTGPGTNTYLVTSEDECLIIDPGPIIDVHRRTIVDALVGLQPQGVVVTHTHSDHAPLANPLASQLGVPAYGHAPGPGFDPDRRLRDNDRITFGTTSIEVLHTPGHADDHLCFLLDDLLFTGDHIKGGSSVMVEDMSPYLRSLERLLPLSLARLYPGHGDEIDDPHGTIAEYIEHRLDREREIVAAMVDGAGTVGAIVETVYHDVDRALHPLAASSVVAHLRKLREEGRADFDDDNLGGFEDHDGRWHTSVHWRHQP